MITNVIDPNQTTFLPLRFIMDNSILYHEVRNWAQCFYQSLIFLKVDFWKAFDKINISFLFVAMTKLGMDDQFIDMVKVLFQGAQAVVLVNGGRLRTFPIKRGVR